MDLPTWYRDCTKAIFISKGSYGYGETRNVFTYSVQKPLAYSRVVKLPRLMGVGIGPRTETCRNCGGPTAMVPCLHQLNTDMKRKLRVRRDLKCISLVGAKTSPVRAVKIPRLKGVGIGPRTKTCGNCGGPNVTVPCLHQGNIYIKSKLRVWRDLKCIPLVDAKTSLTCAGRQTTPSQGSQYRSENGNLWKVGWTYCHGTVFAPRQCLYQKKATGMERPEMYSPSRCKNPT